MKLRGIGNHALSALLAAAVLLAGAAPGLLGLCGAFTDVTDAAFCPFVLEIFTLGITTGVTATTYEPATSVNRLQMAAFLSRTVDTTLKRSSRRTLLSRFWTPGDTQAIGLVTVGATPEDVKFDGLDLWVANYNGASISRVRASSGNLLGTWTGATHAEKVLVAIGSVFATGAENPGKLYRIDPSGPAGAVTTVVSVLPNFPVGVTFDGARVWTANFQAGSVSIVTPGASIPWTVTTVNVNMLVPWGALYDGTNVWITDAVLGLLRLDSQGTVLQTVTIGSNNLSSVYDGGNIWTPAHNDNTVWVVRASSGAVLATLTGNGLDGPVAAAFDGDRIVVTNQAGGSVSLWRAGDFTPLGSFSVPGSPTGVCSDGTNFWIAMEQLGSIARF
jgi:hypothetical protein